MQLREQTEISYQFLLIHPEHQTIHREHCIKVTQVKNIGGRVGEDSRTNHRYLLLQIMKVIKKTYKRISTNPSSINNSFCSRNFKTLSSMVFSIINFTILGTKKMGKKYQNQRKIYVQTINNNSFNIPDWFVLAYSMNPVLYLPLHDRIPPRIHNEQLMPSK